MDESFVRHILNRASLISARPLDPAGNGTLCSVGAGHSGRITGLVKPCPKPVRNRQKLLVPFSNSTLIMEMSRPDKLILN